MNNGISRSEIPEPKCDCRQCESEGNGHGAVILSNTYYKSNGSMVISDKSRCSHCDRPKGKGHDADCREYGDNN